MQMDRQAFAEHYRQLSDERLEHLAMAESSELVPEAMAALHDELQRRGLGAVIERAEAQQHEIEVLVESIRRAPCPHCRSTARKLNALKIGSAVSMVILTFYDAKVLIACPPCLARAARQANTTSMLLGWWGFPWGPIRTIQAMQEADRALARAEQAEPTEELLEYVQTNADQIAANAAAATRGTPAAS
jgi:hypothetical protein